MPGYKAGHDEEAYYARYQIPDRRRTTAPLPQARALARRGDARPARPDRKVPAGAQRLHHHRPRRCAESREGVRGALAEGRAGRPGRRHRRNREGQRLAQGISLAPRVAHHAGHADEGRCARGRAAARGRRGHPRQDHAPGIRLDRRLPFAAHRHHAQSMEARPHARRLVRRRGLRRAAQSRPPAHRHRRRGLDPHPFRLHRRVRHQAELRPRAPPIRPRRSASSRIPGR